jgi:hypothetical protein
MIKVFLEFTLQCCWLLLFTHFCKNIYFIFYILKELCLQSLSWIDYGQINVLLDVNLCVPNNSKVGRIRICRFLFYFSQWWYMVLDIICCTSFVFATHLILQIFLFI